MKAARTVDGVQQHIVDHECSTVTGPPQVRHRGSDYGRCAACRTRRLVARRDGPTRGAVAGNGYGRGRTGMGN